MLFTRYHYLCEREDTQFWKDCTSMPIPTKLLKILNSNKELIPKSNSELISMLELKIEENDITFFPYSYYNVNVKNKKRIKNKLI
jgi:hypothetical protein